MDPLRTRLKYGPMQMLTFATSARAGECCRSGRKQPQLMPDCLQRKQEEEEARCRGHRGYRGACARQLVSATALMMIACRSAVSPSSPLSSSWPLSSRGEPLPAWRGHTLKADVIRRRARQAQLATAGNTPLTTYPPGTPQPTMQAAYAAPATVSAPIQAETTGYAPPLVQAQASGVQMQPGVVHA